MSEELRQETRRREEEQQRLHAEQEQFVRDLGVMAAMPEGVRLFGWFVRQGNIFGEEYQPGSVGAFAAGKKAAALRLWKLLERTVTESQFAAITRTSRGCEPGTDLVGGENI